MPLLHSRATKTTYNNLVDKVHARLASWKSKVLSSSGRATIIQAVAFAIPDCAMQTAKLPMSICDELDKLNHNFFSGGSDKKIKVHHYQWDLVRRPKCDICDPNLMFLIENKLIKGIFIIKLHSWSLEN